jgi:ATP-dependent helicase Lhr and Lhr-like helicase
MNAPFHPLIRQWFSERFGEPTPVQRACWESASKGGHILATAPTGSGKTLAAFLWFLNEMAEGRLSPDELSILYVSPLKALNSDVRLNLLSPLAELEAFFAAHGQAFPKIGVSTRSGDTTQAERRAMLKRPPSLLITTPESLSILVNSKGGSAMLSTVKVLILDEIHAVAGTKRGAFLMAAAERLVDCAGEFQRLALSATVRPLELAAAFVGGQRLIRKENGDAVLEPRPVEILSGRMEREYELVVEEPGRPDFAGGPRAPGSAAPSGDKDNAWEDIAARLVEIARRNASTLVFATSRRNAEKCVFLMNRAAGETLAYVHHGSLSREIRHAVEGRMKRGELKAIVATSSLELGIDIGSVDEVVLLGATAECAQALQRLGRSGHGPGRTVRGRFIPLHPGDLLRCAILSKAVLDRAIEPLRPPENPLDVLSQALLCLCLDKPRSREDLYALSRRSWNFRNLAEGPFDAVLSMLCGSSGAGRIRDVKKRLWRDAESGDYLAAPGTAAILATSGGTIPDRGYYSLKVAGSDAVIGELDEEFVWERRPGEGFSLGNQRWKILSVSDREVRVVPLKSEITILPFWKAERQFMSTLLSSYLLAFLAETEALPPGELAPWLKASFPMTEGAALCLADYLARQEAAVGLPGPRRIVVEKYADPLKTSGGFQVIVHTLAGGGVNHPLSLIMKEALERRFGFEAEVLCDNDCLVIVFPESMAGEEPDFGRLIPSLADPELWEKDLRARLESSGFFASTFRENAVRALLIARSTFGKRMPLWLMRARAKSLHAEAARAKDFPIVTETWRECLMDWFDLGALESLIRGLSDGSVEVRYRATRVPSPFASSTVWRETDDMLYRRDGYEPTAKSKASVSEQAVKEAVSGLSSRPPIEPESIEDFESRVQRRLPGYAPESAAEFLEFLKDRVSLSPDEIEELCSLGGLDAARLRVSGQLAELPGRAWAHAELAARIARGEGLPRLAEEWSRYRGPFSLAALAAAFGIDAPDARRILGGLEDDGLLVSLPASTVVGEEAGSSKTLYCDPSNLEIIYRVQKRRHRPEFQAKPAAALAPFLARRQGIGAALSGEEGVRQAIETLLGYPAKSAVWENAIFPARIGNFDPRLLEAAVSGCQLFCFGAGGGIAFCFPQDFPALMEELPEETVGGKSLDALPRKFWDIKDRWGLGIEDCAKELKRLFELGRAACMGFAALKELDALPVQLGQGRLPQSRWRTGPFVAGEWFDPRKAFGSAGSGGHDAVDAEELNRARILLLAGRYGVLLKPLLERELPGLGWGRLFKTMRRLELSGELVSGNFFEGLPGPQFMTPEAFRDFQSGQALDFYALSSEDPASLCGIGIVDGIEVADAAPAGIDMPPRKSGIVLAYRGEALVLASRKNGGELFFSLPPGDPGCGAALALVLDLVTRASDNKRVSTSAVNGQAAQASPYAPDLEALGFKRGYRGLEYYPPIK